MHVQKISKLIFYLTQTSAIAVAEVDATLTQTRYMYYYLSMAAQLSNLRTSKSLDLRH